MLRAAEADQHERMMQCTSDFSHTVRERKNPPDPKAEGVKWSTM